MRELLTALGSSYVLRCYGWLPDTLRCPIPRCSIAISSSACGSSLDSLSAGRRNVANYSQHMLEATALALDQEGW